MDVPHSRPSLGEEEAEAVRRVVLSGQVAQGPEVRAFEEEMAARVGRQYAVAVSSGTAGLHLALLALGVGEGDPVCLPSYVCSALLHAAWAVRARPVVADIEFATRNLDPAGAERRSAPPLRALIVPHQFGLPAAIERFQALGTSLIEDCATAIGGQYRGRPVGSFGDASVCSFYATKVMCSGGEGGMVLTDRPEVADRVRGLREYDGMPAAHPRFNCKMSELAAAMGRVQLRRLDAFVAKRQSIAATYDQALAGLPVALPAACPGRVYQRYVLHLTGQAGDLIARLEARGVAARRPVFMPLHRELGQPDHEYPHTACAHGGDVSVPLYPALRSWEIQQVIEAIRHALEEE